MWPTIRKPFTYLFIACCLFSVTSCSNTGSGDESEKNNGSVPEFRTTVNAEPVASFKERTDNRLNDWYFSVQLLETKKTFYYLIKMQFEEIRGEDTLHLPDFGLSPKPGIIKGKDKYSCIIGFYDHENKFREYKQVSVVNGAELKLTTLNHYSVVGK